MRSSRDQRAFISRGSNLRRVNCERRITLLCILYIIGAFLKGRRVHYMRSVTFAAGCHVAATVETGTAEISSRLLIPLNIRALKSRQKRAPSFICALICTVSSRNAS